MKLKNYIAAFLSAYMFALMLLPCNDVCNSGFQTIPLTFQAAQDHHQVDNDICSPFCFCSCCATAMTVVHIPILSLVPDLAFQDFTSFYQSFNSNDTSSIWQPPKLS